MLMYHADPGAFVTLRRCKPQTCRAAYRSICKPNHGYGITGLFGIKRVADRGLRTVAMHPVRYCRTNASFRLSGNLRSFAVQRASPDNAEKLKHRV